MYGFKKKKIPEWLDINYLMVEAVCFCFVFSSSKKTRQYHVYIGTLFIYSTYFTNVGHRAFPLRCGIPFFAEHIASIPTH